MTPEKQHSIFMNWFNYYMNLFNMLRWEFYDEFGTKKSENKKDELFKNGGSAVNVNCLQRTVQIYFYPFVLEQHQNEEYLRETALHEILHVLLMPLGKNIEMQHEIINTILHGLQMQNMNQIVLKKYKGEKNV